MSNGTVNVIPHSRESGGVAWQGAQRYQVYGLLSVHPFTKHSECGESQYVSEMVA